MAGRGLWRPTLRKKTRRMGHPHDNGVIRKEARIHFVFDTLRRVPILYRLCRAEEVIDESKD